VFLATGRVKASIIKVKFPQEMEKISISVMMMVTRKQPQSPL